MHAVDNMGQDSSARRTQLKIKGLCSLVCERIGTMCLDGPWVGHDNGD